MESTLAAGRRALAIVERLGSAPAGLSFSELAIELRLSAASLTRLLKILVAEDWIRQDQPGSRYVLGYRTYRLSHSIAHNGPQNPLLESLVTNLAYESGHSACISTFQGDYFVLTAKFEHRHSYHFIDVYAPNTDWIGNGMGQFLLAHQDLAVVARVYQNNFAIDVPADHIEQFEAIRREGSLVRVEGNVTRVITGFSFPGTTAIQSVAAVAAVSSESIDVEAALRKVRSAAREAERRLAVAQAPNALSPTPFPAWSDPNVTHNAN